MERRGSVRIDASSLGEHGDVVSQRILENLAVVFEREAVAEAQDASDPVMQFVIEPLQGETPGHRITYRVTRSGETVPCSDGETLCHVCTEDELVDAAVSMSELLVDKMEVELAKPEVVAEPEEVAEPEHTSSQDSGSP